MKYGFIGAGNMGSAIVKSLIKSTNDIVLSDRSGKAKVLAEELNIKYDTNEFIANNCEYIFLGVKPYMLKDVVKPLKDILNKRKPVVVSMLAGVNIKDIEEHLDTPIIRIMPNTPTAIGKGVIPYCTNDKVTEDKLNIWLNDMRYSGLLDSLEEKLIDAASALSGSGPAYVYELIEAMADGAVLCGMPRAKAYKYASYTLLGSASMQLETNLHPGVLKDQVTSPGGSTIEGLRVLEENGFRGTIINCIKAAYDKNKKLK